MRHRGHDENNCPPNLKNPGTLALNLVLAGPMLLGHLVLLASPTWRPHVIEAWQGFFQKRG